MTQLGKITEGEMILNETGEVVEKCWHQIPEHYPDVILHEFVIMPDHLHGIIELKRKDDADRSKDNIYIVIQNFESRQIQIQKRNEYQKIIPRSVGCIIRGFKIGVTKQLKKSIWQRNYYEHIIRSEASNKRIAQYIINNPKNWSVAVQNFEPRQQSKIKYRTDSKF